MNTPVVHGIHHITAFAGDPGRNVRFYTQVLGLRLVKKSVNQDAPDVYHLFFADAHGTPGTDLTFFPWKGMTQVKEGHGLVSETSFAIPATSLAYWKNRLIANGVTMDAEETRFGESVLAFRDPDGLRLTLTATPNTRDIVIWERSDVPAEHQLRGFQTLRLTLHTQEPTEQLLTQIMGFKKVATEGRWTRFESGIGGSGTFVDIGAFPELPLGRWGSGGVHHVAWRLTDVAEELALREKIQRVGLQPSPKIDRFWFESVYFREPNGIVFELATDGPGFDRDEDMDHLGEELILPPWLEPQRAEIEAALPPITI